MKKGIILASTGSWYTVRDENGERFKGRLRGKLRLKGFRVTNPVTVGDIVRFIPEDSEEKTVLITGIEKRGNYIIRKSPKKRDFGHMIAANVDQALLIVTVAKPKTSVGFIDRYLVGTESFRIPTCLIFNKADLLSREEQERQSKLMALYESIGYPCLSISALEDPDVKSLKTLLKGKISLLSGHSGVGKSTIINRIAPEVNQRTNEISDFSNKGMHTTTFSEMFEIENGTFIIDTPGIREMGLYEIGDEELSHYFPEMRALLGACKYHNCTHTHEPGCAVKAAVEEGLIDYSRFDSYLSILENDDNRR